MGKTTIQLLKSAASKLKDKKLQRLGGKEITEVLNALVLSLGLESKGEAILFTALFEKSCAGRSCDLDDLARYFSCTYLDIMEYVPALKSLISKGLVVQTDMSECQLVCQDFIVTNHVIDCVLENRKIEAWKKHSEESGFNRYDFCKLVDAHVQDDKVKAEELFQFLETAEKENAGMPLVKEAKAAIGSLPARALFYEICYDFMDDDGEGHSDIMRTLKDMYESCGARFRERGALLDGSHSLVKAGLVEISGNKEDMFLSLKGQKLFLGEDFGSFGKQYAGLDCYDFVREVAALVHSKERKRNRLGSRQQLFEKIILMEDSNPQVTSLPLIKGMIPEADCRALFYSVCDACIRGSGVALLEELDALYARKECLVHLQEFKEEKHKLQVLDLVEVRTESGLFGEYTMLGLTDKGKECYFGEDARYFMEKSKAKNCIQALDIKEKRLFFSEQEERQLLLVENSIKEENYQSLVSRLDAKGLSKGIAVLLYGAPGTGKTESVMQWARKTGRDVFHVDISQSKSMWYGESEKIVKEIFTSYKRQCKRASVKPILLFNEADAIFSKRRGIGSGSVDQTENAIQNIILEEMEKLEGILIATTNLADNLDRAFERRFLFKIRFERPSADIKRRIWLDKLPVLAEADAGFLAANFDFSGGEIDNIARKALMMEVLDGEVPSMEAIVKLCGEEKIGGTRSRIGFGY